MRDVRVVSVTSVTPCASEMTSKPAAPRALSGANAAFNDKVEIFYDLRDPSHHSVGETYGAPAFEPGRCQRSVIDQYRVYLSHWSSIQRSVMLLEHRWGQGEWIKWYPTRLSLSIIQILTLFQIQTSKGEVIITNDGATILKSIQALHPAAKMASSSFASLPAKANVQISSLICLLRKMSKPAMAQHLWLSLQEAFWVRRRRCCKRGCIQPLSQRLF
jgi:hypothetical protein